VTILQTRRLRLVPFEPAHAGPLHALWTEPRVRRFLWGDVALTREETLGVIRRSQADWEAMGLGQRVMLLRQEGDAVVGFCGFRRFEETGEPELLYGIHPDYWGEGMVTEAAHASIRDAFERCGAERLVASTDTPNQPGVRVLKRLGMVFECRREWHGLDCVFFALTPEDYEAFLSLEESPR